MNFGNIITILLLAIVAILAFILNDMSLLSGYDGNSQIIKSRAVFRATGKIQDIALKLDASNFTYQKKYNYGPSLLNSEVERIYHMPTENRIVVQFDSTKQRNCQNPRLFGRLSGPYVVLIQWEKGRNKNTSDTNDVLNDISLVINEIIGHYSVPSPGKYFIEVIGLFCNNLEWKNSFQQVCLEDPTNHQITDDEAFIDVVTSTLPQSQALGYWKWSNAQDDPKIMFTRYQPQECRSPEDLNSTRCHNPMSLDRFIPYKFVFDHSRNMSNSNFEESIQIKAQRLQDKGKKIKLCFVGLSHAREMSNELNLILQKWNISSGMISAVTIDAQFPWIVDPNRILQYQCNETVIAAGQWSAGRKPPGGRYGGWPPTGFPQYEKEVTEMILRLQQSKLRNFHLRSIHYNALGDLKTTCPPQDWRSPPVIEEYNDIIHNLSLTMNVSYIDTNFIIGPLWDISEDYCHYRHDQVAEAEALYMLSRLIPNH